MAEGACREATLWVQGGKVVQIQSGLDPKADICTAGFISPGWIDLQLNGAYGFDFSTDGRTVAEVAWRLPETGVTAFLPTVITSPWEAYPCRLREIGEALRLSGGARPLGVHLEGPYLNPVKKGAHTAGFLRPPDAVEALGLADESVRLVTLAPELPGALDVIRRLKSRGIVVSAGHSNATCEEADGGFEAGIGFVTHLFNAMSGLGHRDPGLPGAALASGVPCGFIADGVHTHPSVMKLVYRAKGPDGIVLVTDAMEAMGMPAGKFRLSDREVQVDRHSARLADGTLAGSILTMDQAVRNAVRFTGCLPAEAFRMASTTPAQVLGLEDKGKIFIGADADLVVLDEALVVTHTFVQGNPVFGSGQHPNAT